MDDIIDLLEARVAGAPGRLLLAWEPFEGGPREWTRGGFLEDVRRVAAGLAARGMTEGDRVLLHSDNSPEFLLTWFACAWLGAVCVVLNPKSSSDELAYCAQRTGAIGIVTQAGLAGVPQLSPDGLRWKAVIGADARSETDAFGHLDGPAVPRARIDPARAGCMLFTSGTTSRPKAVVWSRANALWAAQAGCRGTGLTEDDVALVFVPLYHVVGLAWSVLPALQAGAAIVLQPRFSKSRFWPTALKREASFASHVQFSSAVLFNEPVPPHHGFRLWGNSTWLPDYEARFGVPIVGWWGMTELVAAGILGHPGSTQQPGTIGRAAPGYRLRIAGSAHPELVPGETGELEVQGERGRTLFSGYLDDPEATAAAFTDDGWFRTGDRVRVHEDGSIQFLERARDVIKTGGEGVSPAEVERVIRRVQGVLDVCVVGRPDPVMGEVGVAFVVPSAPELDHDALGERIAAACKELLSTFKVPRDIRFIAQLPLVGINKVAKSELRRLALLSPSPGPSSHA